MATAPPSTNSTSTPTRKKQPFPPEERFWKRYSPHHELPLSSVASFVIHALAIAVLVLGGILLARLGWGERQVPVDALEVIPGGGGTPGGTEGEPTGTGKKEDVASAEPGESKVPRTDQPKENLKPVEPSSQPILSPDAQAARPIDVDPSSGLKNASDRLKELIESKQAHGAASQGRGGSGEGGGKGSGKGTGTGSGSGEGTIKNTRQKRQARWTMMFNTFNGDDYARQLEALGAILAVDGPGGQLLVIDNLRQRPVHPQAKDTVPDRIFWIDDRPQSVTSLAQALGITPIPQRIVAFFPETLEKELLRKELSYHHLHEDQIFETKFQVQRRGSGYEPLVVDQTRNR
jgi:hypothetical protein